jgi:hypothetical protein
MTACLDAMADGGWRTRTEVVGAARACWTSVHIYENDPAAITETLDALTTFDEVEALEVKHGIQFLRARTLD